MDPTRSPSEPITTATQKAAAPQPSAAADGMARQVLGTEVELELAAPLPAEAPEAGDSAPPPEGLGGGPIPRWTRPPLPSHHAPALARNPSLPTFVGLIMLILTFFIVLTSISINDRKKSDAALASLQDAFSGNMVTPEQANDLDMDTAQRDFIEGLTGQIQSLVPLMGGKKASPSEHQILWLPLSLAFAGGASELEPTFPPVLRELLNASAKIPPRFDYQVEVRLCAAQPSDALRLRATALAAALAKLQAPMDRYVIGTQDCQADRLGFAVAMTPVAPLPPPSGAEANP